MCPDVQDAQLAARSLRISSADAELNWADAARVHCFLLFCLDHGKRVWTPVAEIQQAAEDALGHTISPVAFQIGLAYVLKNPSGAVKFPRLNQIQFGEDWQQELQRVEKEIASCS